MDDYYFPEGFTGKGSDIKWCSRAHGGKRCMLCKHYTKFEEWSQKYHWYYLHTWWDQPYRVGYYDRTPKDATCMMREIKSYGWGRNQGLIKATEPPRYRTPGIEKYECKALLRNGCKENRRCKCVKIIQRGNWYCPECYQILEKMAEYTKEHIHTLMISNLDNLRLDMLVLKLSGNL